MSQTKRTAMHLVLIVRQRREEVQERALSTVLTKIRMAEMQLEDLRSARERLIENRSAASGLVLTGADYMDQDLRYRILGHSLDRAAADIRTLVQKRDEQSAMYAEARCQREVISELVEQKAKTQQAAEDRAEQRRADDNFLGRSGQKKNSAVQDYDLAEITDVKGVLPGPPEIVGNEC